jgi:hypothetical protein
MKTITVSDQLLNELFPDFTTQLVRAWTRGRVDGLAAEVVDAIDSQPAYPTGRLGQGPVPARSK